MHQTRAHARAAIRRATYFLASMPPCMHSAPTKPRATVYALPRESPLLLCPLGAFRFALPFRLFGSSGHFQPARGHASYSSFRSVGMGLVNCLGHFANVFSRLAFRLDGVGID